jgi:hypothetical protein
MNLVSPDHVEHIAARKCVELIPSAPRRQNGAGLSETSRDAARARQREESDPIVAPPTPPGERRHRKKLDRSNAEFDEVVELLNRAAVRPPGENVPMWSS